MKDNDRIHEMSVGQVIPVNPFLPPEYVTRLQGWMSMQPINEQASQEICNRVSQYVPRRPWHKTILRLTYPIWHPLFTHIFWELYNKGVIDSSRVHIASALTDRTQQHKMW